MGPEARTVIVRPWDPPYLPRAYGRRAEEPFESDVIALVRPYVLAEESRQLRCAAVSPDIDAAGPYRIPGVAVA
ncbi:hypothetical protein [Streptomyces sp. 8N706]|uniref:hypothetical protein n=1 Tax=Streptomyces sp. 8N706 TaxID=3457416 RepID=UPI003FCF577D